MSKLSDSVKFLILIIFCFACLCRGLRVAAAAVWVFGSWGRAAVVTVHWAHCDLLITLHWNVQHVISDVFFFFLVWAAALTLLTVRRRWQSTRWTRGLQATPTNHSLFFNQVHVSVKTDDSMLSLTVIYCILYNTVYCTNSSTMKFHPLAIGHVGNSLH